MLTVCWYTRKKSAEKESPVHESKAPLNEQELHALHYFGGYVMHNLFKKIKKSMHYNAPSSKQSLIFLMSTKSIGETQNSLVSHLTRGGPWDVNQYVMQIIMIAEEIFCSKVSENMREIKVTALVDLSIRNIKSVKF